MSGLVQGRGGVLQGQKYTGAANQKLSRPAQLSNKHSCFFFFFSFLLLHYFDLILVAAKMTTAVVSPFFDYEVMNKVDAKLFIFFSGSLVFSRNSR